MHRSAIVEKQRPRSLLTPSLRYLRFARSASDPVGVGHAVRAWPEGADPLGREGALLRRLGAEIGRHQLVQLAHAGAVGLGKEKGAAAAGGGGGDAHIIKQLLHSLTGHFIGTPAQSSEIFA